MREVNNIETLELKTKTWQVYHNTGAAMFIRPATAAAADWEAGELARSAAYRKVAEVEAESLEEVFYLTNHAESSWTKNSQVKPLTQRAVRSTSVGDVIVLGEQAWLVDSVGFRLLASSSKSKSSSSATPGKSPAVIAPGACDVPEFARLMRHLMLEFGLELPIASLPVAELPPQPAPALAKSAIRLQLPGEDCELTITTPEPNVVSVGYQPCAATVSRAGSSSWSGQAWYEMTFWLEPVAQAGAGRWYPIEHNFPLTGRRSLAHVLYDGGIITGISRVGLEQQTAASFVEGLWLAQLREQNWLAYGQLVEVEAGE